MTVAATAARKVISGSGWSNPLEFADLYIESSSHIKVWADDELLSLGTDYTVAGVQDTDGFEVTIVDTEMAPDNFIIEHVPPMTQGADLSGGGVFGLAYMAALDAIVRRMQSLEDRVNRSMKASRSTALDAEEPALPDPEDGKFLRWAGDVLTNAAIISNGDLAVVDNDDMSLFGDGVPLRQNVDAAISTAISTAVAALAAVYQPKDSDLTAIAALTTTTFGRAFLALADEAAFKAAVNLEIGVDVQGYDADTAKLDVEDQILTGGARVTSKSLGTITSGTVTPDPGDRPMQHYTNNGAHTLAPGSNTGSYLLDITNDASAGAVTTSGWTKVAGDAFTTTNGHKFRCSCSVGNAGSLLIVQALQ